jgi:membrane protease YdiL (CAAX protease family)
MLQLYFLSVLFNALCGYILYSYDEEMGNSGEKALSNLFNTPGFQLICGICAAAVAVLVLLLPLSGIPILGDLVPSAAGLVGAYAVVFGIYRRNSSIDVDSKINRLGESLFHFRKILGIVLMAVSLLHFLFPKALLL